MAFDRKEEVQLYILTELLHLQERLRGITLEEVRFVAVNETYNIIEYETAILWEYNQNTKPKITAFSGVPEVERQNIFSQFLDKLHTSILCEITEIKTFSPNDCLDKNLQQKWDEFLATHLIAVPLQSLNSRKNALLLLAKKAPWQKNEQEILKKIAATYGHEIDQRQKTSRIRKKIPLLRSVLLGTLGLILLLPVRTSTLAPAEIIAVNPHLIRAGIDGIIEEIHIKPNQIVTAGELLISFDKAALVAQKEISQKTLQLAQVMLRQTEQEALSNPTIRAQLENLRAQVEKEKTNLEYYDDIVNRSIIKAPEDGTVIFEDVYDWLGRPVSTGERIMLLADENHTELEIRLAVENAIDLPDDSDILFFSNATPDKPLKARLYFHSYRASETHDGKYAYRLKASWDETNKLDQNSAHDKRLGTKGTAKLYGHRRPLIWQILRTPFVKLRQWIGM